MATTQEEPSRARGLFGTSAPYPAVKIPDRQEYCMYIVDGRTARAVKTDRETSILCFELAPKKTAVALAAGASSGVLIGYRRKPTVYAFQRDLSKPLFSAKKVTAARGRAACLYLILRYVLVIVHKQK